MKNVVGLNHLTAEICGIRSVIMLRLGVELGFEHTLEEVDKLHYLVSASGRAPRCDKGATWQDFPHPEQAQRCPACQAFPVYTLCWPRLPKVYLCCQPIELSIPWDYCVLCTCRANLALLTCTEFLYHTGWCVHTVDGVGQRDSNKESICLKVSILYCLHFSFHL